MASHFSMSAAPPQAGADAQPGASRPIAYLLEQYQCLMDTLCAPSHAKDMDPRHRSALDRLLVAVVDDDESIRESLPDLLRELGYASRSFASAREFLISETITRTNCLLLDIAMPGMTGLDL